MPIDNDSLYSESTSQGPQGSKMIEWFDHHYEQTKATIYQAASAYYELLGYDAAYYEEQIQHANNNDNIALGSTKGFSSTPEYTDALTRVRHAIRTLAPLLTNAKHFTINFKANGSMEEEDAMRRMQKHEREVSKMARWMQSPHCYRTARLGSPGCWQKYYDDTLVQRERVRRIMQTYQP